MRVRKVGLGEYDSEHGNWQWMFHLKQLHFDEIGVAWKVWDGGVGFCRWMIENQAAFAGKKVLEVGSGLGISGLCCGLFARSVLLSDYTPKVMQILRDNIKTNLARYPQLKGKIKITSLDWTSESVPEPCTYDIVIGTEVVYDPALVSALAKTLHVALKKGGIFYGVSAAVRQGIPDFVTIMEELGFTVERSAFPPRLLPDTKLEYGSNECIFFICIKKE